jgi:hypothetical protein
MSWGAYGSLRSYNFFTINKGRKAASCMMILCMMTVLHQVWFWTTSDDHWHAIVNIIVNEVISNTLDEPAFTFVPW